MDFTAIQKRVRKTWNTHPTYIALGVFAVLIVVFYGNTLGNGFIYDDFQQVESNEYIRSLQYLPNTVTGCIWEFAHGQCEGRTHYYRPVQFFSYIITYQFFSGAWFFHLINLVYFFAIATAIFVLVQLLSKNNLAALISSLVFLVHPINSEVVNWISGIPDLTFAFFSLLSTIFYVKHRQEESGEGGFFRKHKHIALASLFFFLSLLSKEPAILLPVAFLLLDVFVLKKRISNYFRIREIAIFGTFAILAGVYLIARVSVIGGLTKPGFGYYGSFSIAERIYATVTLLGTYLGKLIFPYPLQFSYPFERMADFASSGFVVSFLAAILLGALTIFAFRQRQSIGLFSILWFLLFLSPVLVFFNSLGDSVFSERYLFVPMIGFAIAAGNLFSYVWNRERIGTYRKVHIQKVLLGLLVFLLAISFFLVWQRNRDWHDNETFFLKSLEENPQAHQLRYNLSVLQRQSGDVASSFAELTTIENMAPRAGARTWDGMIMVYLHLGDYHRDVMDEKEKALEYYQKSIAIAEEWNGDWKGAFAQDRIGSMYAASEQYIKALPYLCRVLQGDPDAPDKQTKFNLALTGIDEQYKDDLSGKYEEIVSKGGFEKRTDRRVLHEESRCEGESCSVLFSFRFQEFETVLPSLITAKDSDGEAIDIESSAFNPTTSQAMFQVAAAQEGKSLTFIFPTCEGVYYESETNNQNSSLDR